MPEELDPPALLAAIDAERERLRALLAGRDEAALAERPPNGKWSVVENVRHLLFAEQLHLGRYLPGGRVLNPLGWPTAGMRGENGSVARVPWAERASLDDVFGAWQATHESVCNALADDPNRAAKQLAGNLHHLQVHIRVIERLLRPMG